MCNTNHSILFHTVGISMLIAACGMYVMTIYDMNDNLVCYFQIFLTVINYLTNLISVFHVGYQSHLLIIFRQ